MHNQIKKKAAPSSHPLLSSLTPVGTTILTPQYHILVRPIFKFLIVDVVFTSGF